MEGVQVVSAKEEETPPKKAKTIDSSSSSESDIENYLHKPQDLKLNSTFFQVIKSPVKKKVATLDAKKCTLSDSDSDDPLDIYVNKDKASCSKPQQKQEQVSYAFKELNKQAQELEEARKQVEAYLAKRRAEKANKEQVEVDDLLAIGEKPFDLAKDLAEVGFHPSDFESGNESEKDWEDVQESQLETNIIPKDGVQITLAAAPLTKKKNGIDLMAALKRRMNRVKKENQVFVHKVHLLCWIAHGNYANSILNRESIMCLALSLLPSKDCYPPERSNLKYLEQVTTWYHKAMKYKPEQDEVKAALEDKLLEQIGNKVATTANILVYVFIAMLRALGLQCRLVLSLDVAPLRPPFSELCSLRSEKALGPKETASKVKKVNAQSGSASVIPVKPKKVKTNLTKLKSFCDDDDFQSELKSAKSIKSLRSKSVSKMEVVANEKRSLLDVPGTKTSTRRSKSASEASKQVTTKSKLELSIDKTLATLEALEKPQTSSKPNLSKLKRGSTTTSDDDICDRASWRRSKSPLKPSPSPKSTKKGDLTAKRQTRSSKRAPPTDDEVKAKTKVRVPSKRIAFVPQVDGHMDVDSADESLSDSDDEIVHSIIQLDGADDKPSKLRIKLKMPSSFDDGKSRTPFEKIRHRDSPNINNLSSPMGTQSPAASTSKFDIKQDIIQLVKTNVRDEEHRRKSQLSCSYKEEDSDSDFMPLSVSPKKKKKPTPKSKVKKRVLPRSQLEAKAKEEADRGKAIKGGVDIWVEVFLEEEEKWICADVVSGKVHCIKEIHNKASHPIAYILAWDNASRIKDVTKRYCPNWNTVTRRLRIDPQWWHSSLQAFVGKKTARDREEDEDLARQQLDQPLPKTITEYKDHPLYVLKRHLLKFQAIYPPDAVVLGFVRKEEVYSRDCVYVLHSRDIWLKHAKVVKLGEQPYKIVKARPKYDKLSNSMITDQLLEIFGEWQVEDYVPPTAENGVVPRNAYGNVELFKTCMLPKKCVHLQLPGLNKVARKLNIDCATAVVGFDFHSGWNHAVYDGFVVCEEFRETLVEAWEQEQEEIVKREQEKYEKRVFGNWRRLIKAAFIRERLKRRYDFGGNAKAEQESRLELEISPTISPQPAADKKKLKRPKFMSRK